VEAQLHFFLFFPLPFVRATGGSISNNPSCNSADDGCDPALPLLGCVVVTTDPVADGPLPSDPLAVVSSLAGCAVVATDSVADGPLPGDPFSICPAAYLSLDKHDLTYFLPFLASST